jgi:hypothetical protein
MKISIGLLTVIAAIAVPVITWLQVRINRRQGKQMEIQVTRIINSEWKDLRLSWGVALMIGRGVGDYYVSAPWPIQLRFIALQRAAEASYQYTFSNSTSEENSIEVPESIEKEVAQLDENELRIEMQQLQAAIDDVLEFFAQLAGRVFRGELSVFATYETLGSAILNNAAPIRELVRYYKYSDLFPGNTDRVLSLIDLLWALGVKVGDISLDTVYPVAEHKRRTGSGQACRFRVRRLAFAQGATLHGIRLQRLLCFAEVPEKRRRFARAYRLVIGLLQPRSK